jgi:protein-tyrosine-phosphatase
MSTETAFDYLPLEHRIRMIDSSHRLQHEFDGRYDAHTIDRFLRTSYDDFTDHAEAEAFAPLFAERFARVRLAAMLAMEQKSADSVPIVLFLSEHDASRAQMACAMFRRAVDGRAATWSGGHEPDVAVSPEAITAMDEIGIDISTATPNPWNNEIIRAADVVVMIGCASEVPRYVGRRYLDWAVMDSGGLSLDGIRSIRDDLRDRVEGLVVELGLTDPEPAI